ncbi:UNKNOWN [Stylonychia lemnae]|uniref:Uncharacterized protein n=1 Tax=Stylonychia lemnae TaxID=5949 RepID=A0A078AF02_STYLE|nr:UNKNOWN [Stylonychia lemnae]|eukprot:CDW79483.1 UNKNOWN [Stylonychia lemnae]
MRRRHQIFNDHIELRLELFFFDELVQLATQSLSYLELQHNCNFEKIGRELLPFDFGKNKEAIIEEQKRCRDNMRFSFLTTSRDQHLQLVKQGSFLFHQYRVPDMNEINQMRRGLQITHHQPPLLLQPSQFQQLQQSSDILEDQSEQNDDFTEDQDQSNQGLIIEEYDDEQQQLQQPEIQGTNEESSESSPIRLGLRSHLISRERRISIVRGRSQNLYAESVDDLLQCVSNHERTQLMLNFHQQNHSHTPHERPSNAQHQSPLAPTESFDHSVNSLKSESGSSCSPRTYDNHIEILNERTQNRVPIAKKLKKDDNNKPISRRISQINEDENSLLTTKNLKVSNPSFYRLGSQSMGSGGKFSEQTGTPSPNKRIRREQSNTKSKYKIKPEELWALEKSKIKESLLRSSKQNNQIVQNKKYVDGFKYLRRMAKVKIVHLDSNVIQEEQEDEQQQNNFLNEPQFGGIIQTSIDDLENEIYRSDSESEEYKENMNIENVDEEEEQYEEDYTTRNRKYSQTNDQLFESMKLQQVGDAKLSPTDNKHQQVRSFNQNAITVGTLDQRAEDLKSNKKDKEQMIENTDFNKALQQISIKQQSPVKESFDDSLIYKTQTDKLNLHSNYMHHKQDSSINAQIYRTDWKPAPFVSKTNNESLQRLSSNKFGSNNFNNNYESTNSSFAGSALKINLDKVYQQFSPKVRQKSSSLKKGGNVYKQCKSITKGGKIQKEFYNNLKNNLQELESMISLDNKDQEGYGATAATGNRKSSEDSGFFGSIGSHQQKFKNQVKTQYHINTDNSGFEEGSIKFQLSLIPTTRNNDIKEKFSFDNKVDVDQDLDKLSKKFTQLFKGDQKKATSFVNKPVKANVNFNFKGSNEDKNNNLQDEDGSNNQNRMKTIIQNSNFKKRLSNKIPQGQMSNVMLNQQISFNMKSSHTMKKMQSNCSLTGTNQSQNQDPTYLNNFTVALSTLKKA